MSESLNPNANKARQELLEKSLEQQKQWLQNLLAVHGALAAFHALLGIFGNCHQVIHFLLSLLHTGVAVRLTSVPDDDEPGVPIQGGGGRGGG